MNAHCSVGTDHSDICPASFVWREFCPLIPVTHNGKDIFKGNLFIRGKAERIVFMKLIGPEHRWSENSMPYPGPHLVIILGHGIARVGIIQIQFLVLSIDSKAPLLRQSQKILGDNGLVKFGQIFHGELVSKHRDFILWEPDCSILMTGIHLHIPGLFLVCYDSNIAFTAPIGVYYTEKHFHSLACSAALAYHQIYCCSFGKTIFNKRISIQCPRIGIGCHGHGHSHTIFVCPHCCIPGKAVVSHSAVHPWCCSIMICSCRKRCLH